VLISQKLTYQRGRFWGPSGPQNPLFLNFFASFLVEIPEVSFITKLVGAQNGTECGGARCQKGLLINYLFSLWLPRLDEPWRAKSLVPSLVQAQTGNLCFFILKEPFPYEILNFLFKIGQGARPQESPLHSPHTTHAHHSEVGYGYGSLVDAQMRPRYS